MPEMRYGSLFSGIEAESLAWEPLGWTPAWFAEKGIRRQADSRASGGRQAADAPLG